MRRKAVSIEWLLTWTYQVQRVPVGRPGEPIVPQRRTTGDGTFLAATLGTAVQGGGGGMASHHPDAEMIADTIARLPGLQRVLVERYGLSGVVPEWYPQAHQVERVRMVGRRQERFIATLALVPNGSDWEDVPGGWETVTFGRREYLTFYAGIKTLSEIVALSDYEVSGIETPLEPWISA